MTLPPEPKPLPPFTLAGLVWITVALGLFITGLSKGINLLLLLSYMLAGLLFVNAMLVRKSMRSLSARREWRTPVQPGEPIDWRIVLSNGSDEPLRGFQVTEQVGTRPLSWTVDRLAGQGQTSLREKATFEIRGRHPLGTLRIVTRFPFGFVQKAIDLPGQQDVVVLPRLGQIRVDAFQKWLTRVSRGEAPSRRRRPLQTPQQADLHGLRAFRPGDSLRWIDWKSSARRGELITREFEDDAPPHLILIVEAWLPAAPSEAERQKLEEILSLAGTICRDWCRDRSHVLHLVVLEEIVQTACSAGGERSWELIELLAPLRGVENPARLESRLPGRPRGATDSIVALTTNPNSQIAEEVGRLYRQPVARLGGIEGLDWYAIK